MARMTRPSLLLGLAAAALTAAAGCVDTDPTVFVDASIGAPAAQVTSSTLVTQVAGGFQLTLALGPRASGPSQVSLKAFSITDADQATTLVDSLEATTVTALPVEVAPDEEVVLDLRFDQEVDAAAAGALCDPAGIRFVGSIQDSLQDGATPVASSPFPATCMLL